MERLENGMYLEGQACDWQRPNRDDERDDEPDDWEGQCDAALIRDLIAEAKGEK
ncbi:MAG: hypothetical protein ACYTG0_38640 [Planctomycetota bacterium]|jgi:hypothetical protein